MAITIPSIQELQTRISNDLIQSVNTGQLDTSKHIDPTIRNSFAKGLVDSMAAGFDENNDILNQLLIQIFPQTATGIYLERWASFFGITRAEAVKATGTIVFTGTAGGNIPASTLIQRADGVEYATISAATISTQTINVSSITRLGSVATVTTASNHNLASGVVIDSITGADQTEYNVTNATITVIDATSFTYEVSGSPVTPATGTMQVTSTTAFTTIEASEFGSNGNANSGSQLNLVSPIVNVDETCYVNQDGLVGGLDVEDDDSLRERLQDRTANFSAPFTQAGLPVFIREKVPGVTRIWVEDATPDAGKVTIYFTRDNDTNIIPTASQANDVKNVIIDVEEGIKPANTPDSYVIVTPPVAVSANFTFSALSPNTEDMRSAITQSLTDYFKSDSVAISTSITEAEYNNIIFSTLDSQGNQPTFTLSSPSGDIVITTGELAVLGTITYP